MNGLRPEWIEAVDAARWNLWLLPLLALAPLLVLLGVLRRWHPGIVAVLFLVAMLGTFCSFVMYSETIWNTMDKYAETDAEIEEVTSDTGRVFGPILVGVPATVIYTTVWLAIAYGLRAVASWSRKQTHDDIAKPTDKGGVATETGNPFQAPGNE